MAFVMDGLDAEGYDRRYPDAELVRRVGRYFRPQVRRVASVAIAIVLASVADTLVPIVVAESLDRAGSAGSRYALSAALLVGLGALSWGMNYVRRLLTARAVGDVVLELREDAMAAVLERDLSFYDESSTGKIVSRVNSDTQAFSQVVVLTIDLFSQLLSVTLLVGYLCWIDVASTLVLLAVSPVVVLVALGFRRVARRTLTQSRRVNAHVSSHIQETVGGIAIAKAFRQEASVHAEFLELNERSFRINRSVGYVFSALFPLLGLLAGLGAAAVAYHSGLRVSHGQLSVGEWFLFIRGVEMFWFPLTGIASFWSQFQLGLAAAERVFALLDEAPRVVQTGALPVDDVRGHLRFEQVDFAYQPGQPVLEGFSLDVPAGQTLALVGHTGSGKSSLLKLIARFYEFQAGSITVDGRDLRSLDLGQYRAHLGCVTQSPFLFDGSVRDNVRYGRPEASDDEVEAVARRVAGGDWILSLADGLDTPVGERGGALSMGQRQLVALCRVLLQDPSVFLLDEATASIDPLTEALIQEGLDTVLAGRTSIVIAHRLSTVRGADRIVVLDQGRILEEGTHEQLSSRGGHYGKLYDTYFRHQSAEWIEAPIGLDGSGAEESQTARGVKWV